MKKMNWVVGCLMLSACGGGGGGTSADVAPAPPDVPGTVPTETLNPSVQTYSASKRGINIVPHGDAEGKLLSCTVESFAYGNSLEFTAEECRLLVQEAQRQPGPYCQVLVEDDVLSLEPSLCTRMVVDGVPLEAADPSGGRAASNADKVLKYYEGHFGRRGLDNQGTDNLSIVHISRNYANAFFDPDLRVMAYGDGDGKRFRDLTYGLDVAGHEMTHGVVAFTSRLLYVEESGALDEGLADFFGELVEGSGDWRMGSTIMIGGKAIRDLVNPGSISSVILDPDGLPMLAPYPAHLKDKAEPPTGEACSADNDNCYVHFNSTIMSHALYLAAQGMGKAKAETLTYLAMTQYYGPATGFQDAADGALLACRQLYDANTCSQLVQAFSQVGLTSG